MEGLQVYHEEYGAAAEVVKTRREEWPALKPYQIRVAIYAAPINPADINMLEGSYLLQPPLPARLGNEAVGVVEDLGDQVEGIYSDDHVIIPFQNKQFWEGLWAEYVVLDYREVLVVPKQISMPQAAMLSVNPLTAYAMLTQFQELNKGEWVVQNLANSGVGRWVIYLAKKLGYKTCNIVRSDASVASLKALGADEVIVYSDHMSQAIKEVAGYARLGLNGVGGNSAKQVAKAIKADGSLVTYGAMGREQMMIGNALLIYRNVSFYGFNRSRWIAQTPREKVCRMYKEIFEMLVADPFTIPVEKTYELGDAPAAVAHAMQSGRQGKILFKMGFF
ncbi:MAG: hypothetical protein CL521_05410 [Actinobacteria bacterium]|nr:hypothetical protein [Actinomycetota bacterium]